MYQSTRLLILEATRISLLHLSRTPLKVYCCSRITWKSIESGLKNRQDLVTGMRTMGGLQKISATSMNIGHHSLHY